MVALDGFINLLRDRFPEDRLTWQKAVPTFHPETAGEAAALVSLANQERQKLFIAGFGNQIDPVGDRFQSVLAIKSDRLNRVVKVVPADYYVTVGAGYPLRELNKTLSRDDLFLPHADLPYVGSVGGALAIGLTCRYYEHLLPISRYFIKATIADPQGNVIEPGSACFKSVSGLDIVKIFSPSWGLLGMIIEATFRVMPVSGRDDYGSLPMEPVDYEKFAGTYSDPGDNVSAQYSLKIKEKFDPRAVFDLILPG